MTKTDNRRAKFETLKENSWYKKYFDKLTKSDLKTCHAFIDKHGELSVGEWESKCNMLWVDRTFGEKPKNGMVIMELLSCANKVGQ